MPDFTDIFGEDFEEILEQLDKLTPQQELLLLGIIEKAAVQAEIIELQIHQELATMITNGMSQKGAEMAIKVDLKKGGTLHGLVQNYTENICKFYWTKWLPVLGINQFFGILRRDTNHPVFVGGTSGPANIQLPSSQVANGS